MSNHLAVAGATATLVQLLDEAVNRDFNGAHVSGGRPDVAGALEPDPEVRVFLYRVEPMAARRNDDLPTRGADASLTQRPQAALTLNYLLTFLGSETDYEPHRLLGICVGTLHFHPLLTRGEIERMVLAESGGPLALVDLAEQDGLVRFTPLNLSIDELSNLWSSFFQVEYRLSVAFQAEVILLTPPETPVRSLPVRERRLFASTMLRPSIRSVVAAEGAELPILPGTLIRIDGGDLRGEEGTIVRFGEASVGPTLATGTRIEVTVPPDVRAGAVGVVVEHQRLMGEPPELRPAGQSNVAPIVVHPRIRPLGPGHDISVRDAVEDPVGIHAGIFDVTVDPAVGSRQEVSLLLNAVGGGGSHSFAGERRDGPSAPEVTNDLSIAFFGVATGDYLVRIVVSGAESELDVETAPGPTLGEYSAPRVSVP
ncbi:DUF4255 domain-containing protein [Micromonospora sp. DT81.3]|uniref:DUF4255 domain-containing protein n=1 Tax=Actinomycetes TaxID=1760 RepID=UPI003CEFD1F4